MAKKVAIVTDSSAYFAPGEAEALGIHVVPLQIQVGNEKFQEGVDIDTDELFRRMSYGAPFPVSRAPQAEVFYNLYSKLYRQTDQILSIHISAQLSDTIQMARRGAEPLLGRCSIEIVDSMTTSVGLGILVKEAAKAASAGMPVDDIIRLIRGIMPHIYLVFYVETMDYLERNGRIGKAQAILGSMLNIKPILFMEDGDIIPLEKVRTADKGIEKLFEFVAEFDSLEQTAIIQRSKQPTKEAKILQERLKLTFPDIDFPIIQYGPDLATRLGPDALGVAVYEGMLY